MAAPKIKLYLLPDNYTEAQDADVQHRTDDELLPVLGKNEALNNVYPLSGVVPWFRAKCYPINYVAGGTFALLGVLTGFKYRPNATPLNIVLVEPSGQLAPAVYLNDQVTPVPPSGYKINLDAVGNLDNVEFVGGPPANAKLRYYSRDTGLTPTSFALPASSPYDGQNPSLSKVVVFPSGGNWPIMSQPYQPTIVGPSGAYFTLPSGATSCFVDFWSKDPNSWWFAADRANWVKDHIRMNPDIFVGTKDYPGDNGEVDGTPFVQGPVPQFRETGTYQINYRDGYVKLTDRVNSALTPVKGNFASIVGVKNVTRMRFNVVPNSSGRVWRPILEQVWPESHGKRVVRRNDAVMPLNVYVNGVIASQPVSVSPYEVLQPKLS